MTSEQANKVIRVLGTDERVFGLEIDSRIRQAGNGMTAGALFRMLHAADVGAEDFAEKLDDWIRTLGLEEPSCLIGFDDGQWVDLPMAEEGGAAEETASAGEPVSHYLRVVYSSVDASYYLFHSASRLFEGTGVAGVGRKREDAVHHVRVDLSDPRQLQHIITRARECPHVVRVEESSADEFWAAPSHNPGY